LGSYALKHEAYAMTPATGAIIWMRSQNAEPAQEERSRAFIETERMNRELQRPSGVHLAPLWRDLGHFRAKLRRLTAAAPWRRGSDLERRSFLWRCCPQDAHRRLAMPMRDRTTAAAKLAQTLIVGQINPPSSYQGQQLAKTASTVHEAPPAIFIKIYNR